MNTKKNSPIKQFGNAFAGGNIIGVGRSVLNSFDPLKNKNNPTNKLLGNMPFGNYTPNIDFSNPNQNGLFGKNFAPNIDFSNPTQNALFGRSNQDYGLGGILKNSQYALEKKREMRSNEIKVATNNKRLVDKGLLPPQPKPASTAPLPQLKSNNMEYNNINSKAFSNTDNIKNVMGESLPNTFTRKVGGSPIKQNIESPIDPMIVQNIDEPLQPPNRIATPTTPPYDINNY